MKYAVRANIRAKSAGPVVITLAEGFLRADTDLCCPDQKVHGTDQDLQAARRAVIFSDHACVYSSLVAVD